MIWAQDIPIPAWIFFFLTALMFICAHPKVEAWGTELRIGEKLWR